MTSARYRAPSYAHRLIDTPLGPLVVTLLVASMFVVLRLATFDWNPTGFIHAGDRFVHASEAPTGLLIREDAIGFDGTGFYRFALDPFTRDVYDHGIVLDIPGFRHQRILYPLIAWIGSGGGRPGAVVWSLIAVNLLALGGIAWVGGALAITLGRSVWWGIALPAYPGFAISLGLDTAEILASLLALTGVLQLMRGSKGRAAVLFTAAMLTRETTLLVPLGIAVAYAWQWGRGERTQKQFPIQLVVAPALAYGVWQVVLWRVWGAVPLFQGSGVDISLPLVGLIQMAPKWPSTSVAQAMFQYILSAAIVVFGVAVFHTLRKSTAPIGIRIAAVLGLLLATLYSDDIWLHHWGFLRAFTEAYLLGVLVMLGSSVRRLDRLVLGAAALWGAIALNLVLHP